MAIIIVHVSLLTLRNLCFPNFAAEYYLFFFFFRLKCTETWTSIKKGKISLLVLCVYVVTTEIEFW